MRLSKIISVFVLVIFTLFIVIYLARASIINYSANKFLSPFNAKITCLDFDFNTYLNIDIKQLCLSAPQANITATNVYLDWQFNAVNTVRKIDISNVKISSNVSLISEKGSKAQTPFTFEQLSSYLDEIAQFETPTTININRFTYQPFLAINQTANNVEYWGNLSADNNIVDFTLYTHSPASVNTKIIDTTLNIKGNNFNASSVIELSPLYALLTQHQIPLPKSIHEPLFLNGTLTSQLNWQDNALTLNNNLQKLSINTPNIAIDELTSGALKVTGDLHWQTHISDNTLTNVWYDNNKLTINYQSDAITQLLEKLTSSKAVLNLFKHNQIGTLNIELKGKTAINYIENSLTTEHIALFIPNNSQSSVLNLTELVMFYGSNSVDEAAVNQVNFELSSDVRVTELNEITQQPIEINTLGTIIHHKDSLKIAITDGRLSTSTLSLKDKSNSQQTLIKINKLNAALTGEVLLPTQQAPAFNLAITTEALTLFMANTAKVEQLKVNTKIVGNLSDINLTNSLIADNLPLAELHLFGAIDKPNVHLYSTKIAIPELLALNLKLPVDIQLINGYLDYDITGKISDISNPLASSFAIDLSLSELTGEVDGTWLQGVNWTQSTSLNNHQLTTTDKHSNSLSIDIIETPTPINKLRANIDIYTLDNEFQATISKLNGKVLGGSFAIPKLTWPLTEHYSADVQLTDIDLEQVLALDKKQGIVVTGKISGTLPVKLNGNNVIMSAGKLYNSTSGLIQVMNNPAVDELKTQNSQLKLAFDALQNLHYHQLSSDVSMQDDGYMLLDTVIKGRNPDLDNDVNLNLNLSYDLLGLLESLTITERFEKSIVEGLKKD